jgi:6-phosphofructokinase 1
VAILAEGLLEKLDTEDFKQIMSVEKDAHDNIRLAEISFGEIIKQQVQKRLAEFKIKTTIVAKNIGYELRCADPIPFDMEYCRDLGFMAAKFLFDGGSGALVSVQDGRFVPIYLKDKIDPKTKRMKIRMVDVKSEYYHVAYRYMIRLKAEDFEDPHELAKYAATAGVSLDEFKRQFEYLVTDKEFLNIGDDGIAHEKVTSSPKKK